MIIHSSNKKKVAPQPKKVEEKPSIVEEPVIKKAAKKTSKIKPEETSWFEEKEDTREEE